MLWGWQKYDCLIFTTFFTQKSKIMTELLWCIAIQFKKRLFVLSSKVLKNCLKASCTRKILRKEIEKKTKKTIKGKQPAIIAINHPFCKESVLFPTHHFN